MRTKFHWRNTNNSNFNPKLHIPSTWNPPKGSVILEKFVSYTQSLYSTLCNSNFFTNTPRFPSNLTRSDREFILELSKNEDIVIKPADKNLGITIMNRSWYDHEVIRQLSDTLTYIPITHVDALTIIKQVRLAISQILRNPAFSQFLTPSATRYLRQSIEITDDHIVIPTIYILPKIHKPTVVGRPILPSYAWITKHISRWLDTELQPLKQHIPTIVKDSTAMINIIENTTINDSNCFLVTADINSLYTEMDTNLGLILMNDFLTSLNLDTVRINLYLQAMRIILENNVLQFKGKFYRQGKGTAMGTPFAPPYADIFVYQLEKQVITELSHMIIIYKRFLDDVQAVLKSNADVNLFQLKLNSLNQFIKFVFKVSPSESEFLDLHFFKGERFNQSGILDIKVHQKSMNTYLYIPYRSCHPSHVKGAFIVTELLRYIRNSSSQSDYIQIKRLFFSRLRARGYPTNFLRSYFDKVRYKDRSTFLARHPKDKSNTPLIMAVQYNPLTRILPLKQGLRSYWSELVNSDPTLAQVFPSPPIIAYSRGRTIQSILITNT